MGDYVARFQPIAEVGRNALQRPFQARDDIRGLTREDHADVPGIAGMLRIVGNRIDRRRIRWGGQPVCGGAGLRKIAEDQSADRDANGEREEHSSKIE